MEAARSGRRIIIALAVAVPVFAAPAADPIAREMVRQAESAPWGQVYQKTAGCSPFVGVGNTPIHAIAQWSFACISTLRGIQRTEYYYATLIGTVTLQYLHLSLQAAEESDNVFLAIEQQLQ